MVMLPIFCDFTLLKMMRCFAKNSENNKQKKVVFMAEVEK